MSPTNYRHQNVKRRKDNMKPNFEKRGFFSYWLPHSPQDGNEVDILESGAYWFGANFHDYPKYPVDSSKQGEIGAWIHPDEVAGDLHYFFGYISDASDVPDGFVKLDVPAAEYAVFQVPPVSAHTNSSEKLALEIRKVWKYIFKEWLDASEYCFNESKMCFEFYYGENTWIYIPVKKKC